MLTKKAALLSSAVALVALILLSILRSAAHAAIRPTREITAAKGIEFMAARGVDPKALKLLTQIVKAYGALKSYSGIEVGEGSSSEGLATQMD